MILPAIVALVAGNFPPEGRPRAYGLVMSAGAIAVAVGPLIGGLATTYASWRWVFVGEVVIVAAILVLARRVQDAPVETRTHFDLIGAGLSAAGLGVAVFGVLRSSLWGWVLPKPGGPAIFGLSPTIVLIFLGLFVLWVFGVWEHHVEERGHEPLVRLAMFGNRQFTGGLLMFFFQFLVQAGLFFTIPLYLSVALGLSAIDTGIKIMPLSITLLAAAAGIPRFLPNISPRLVVQAGLLAMFAGIVWLFMNIDVNAGAEIVTVPLLLAGLGIGALASQLGSVTVSAVPDDQSPAVGGLQNTATNLGASIGTALAGSLVDRGAHGFVPERDRAEPRGATAGGDASERRVGGRDPVRLGRRSGYGPDAGWRGSGRLPGRARRERTGSARWAPDRARRPRPDGAHRAVLLRPDPEGAAGLDTACARGLGGRRVATRPLATAGGCHTRAPAAPCAHERKEVVLLA